MPSISVQRATMRTKQAMIRLSAVVSHRGSIRDVPDIVWDTLVSDLAQTIESVEKIKVDATKFCKSLRDTLSSMTSLATDFNESLVDGDRQEVRDSRQTYCEGVASLRASCILQNISVLESSMIPYLQEFIYEIMDLQNLCEERLKYKLNYDHYVEKVDTMTKDPTCKEANLRRNQEKLQSSKQQLELIETPLVKRLTDFEAKRESVLAYAFSTLGSCQEQAFRLMSQQFAIYRLESHPEVPQIPILENYNSLDDIKQAKEEIKKMPKIPKKSPSAMKTSTTFEPSSTSAAAPVSPMISVTTPVEQTVQPGLSPSLQSTPYADEAAIGPSIYQTSPRMAFPQIPSGYDPYSRTPMGSSAMSTPSVPENPPAPIAMMFSPPPVPQNPPAPVAARYPPPIPANVPSSRSNPPPIPAPPIPASVPSSRSNPPPIPAPPVPANPRAGSVGNSPSQVSVNTPSSDRIYGYSPVDSSNSGCVNLSTSIFPNLPNVPTSVPSSFIPSPLEMPELPTVPSSTPNREEVASPEAIQLEPESM